MYRNQSVARLNNPRLDDVAMEERRFVDRRTDARQLDGPRDERRNSVLRHHRGKRMTGSKGREMGGPANTGLITFRAPQWG